MIKNLQVCSPSNIAFIKYWGKEQGQIPMNSSLSMTLSRSQSIFEFKLIERDFSKIVSFEFEGATRPSFKTKLDSFVQQHPFDFLKEYSLQICSHNTFPHSCGIASSAAAMSAFVFGLCKLEEEYLGAKISLDHMSDLARQASGSACRSFYAPFSLWDSEAPSHAQQATNIHEKFLSLRDVILVVSSESKPVSSSQGHQLMNKSPYRQGRVQEAKDNLNKIQVAMAQGDESSFGEVLEREALSLHGMLLCSGAILLAPKSLALIEKLSAWREQTACHAYFTIDAGANIHLIYFAQAQSSIESFVADLKAQQIIQTAIWDEIGSGPSLGGGYEKI